MIGSLLSALVALSFLGIGAGALVAPAALAENFGLPGTDKTTFAYVRALGARDVALGLVIALLLMGKARGALRTTIVLCGLVGAADATNVYAARGFDAQKSLAIHGAGTIGLLAVWGALRLEI